jgi:type II secretory pathway component PulF
MSWATRIAFFQQIRALLHTGMTLSQALPIAGGRHSPPYSQLAPQWAAATGAGEPWFEQLKKAGEPPLVWALVEAGEVSGRLGEMCKEIQDFYQHAMETRRMVIRRLAYPLLLAHAAMMIPALPGIIVGGNPLWTLIIGPVVFWAVVGGCWLAWKGLAATDLRARIALGMGLRAITRQLVVSNTCLVLRGGLSAGMLAHRAMELAAVSCGNRIAERSLRQQAQGLMDGSVPDLTNALIRADFPGDVVDLIAVGEQSGELERNLGQAATISRKRFRERVTWTFRILTGIVLTLAMAYAALQIISMYAGYVGAMNDVLNDF